jgi:hypothetical protein
MQEESMFAAYFSQCRAHEAASAASLQEQTAVHQAEQYALQQHDHGWWGEALLLSAAIQPSNSCEAPSCHCQQHNAAHWLRFGG